MKKLLSILITAAIACTLTACGNGGEGQVSEETVAVDEMKTIEPPDDGWTAEQLNEVMYLNGKPFKLPCTLDDLGKEFTVDNNTVLYEGKIVFGGNISDEGVCNSLLFSVSQNESSLSNNNLISINGITLETTLQDLFSKMGQAELETKDELTRVIYDVEQLMLIFILNENMEISHISLLWEE